MIALAGAVDGIVQMQAAADAEYFVSIASQPMDEAQRTMVAAAFLAAYRYQYIVTGVEHPQFNRILGGMITAEQGARIHAALEPIVR